MEWPSPAMADCLGSVEDTEVDGVLLDFCEKVHIVVFVLVWRENLDISFCQNYEHFLRVELPLYNGFWYLNFLERLALHGADFPDKNCVHFLLHHHTDHLLLETMLDFLYLLNHLYHPVFPQRCSSVIECDWMLIVQDQGHWETKASQWFPFKELPSELIERKRRKLDSKENYIGLINDHHWTWTHCSVVIGSGIVFVDGGEFWQGEPD